MAGIAAQCVGYVDGGGGDALVMDVAGLFLTFVSRLWVSSPTPDWGLMISDARGFMSFAPWGVIGPVIALSSLIIGINLTADALAKALGIDRAQKAPM